MYLETDNYKMRASAMDMQGGRKGTEEGCDEP